MAQKSNYTIQVTEKGAKKAEKNINGLNSSLGGLAKKAGIAAAGFFGARMLLDGFKQAINLSAQQELAEKKLEASLGRTSQALLDQASALQQQTAFGDEAIIEAQALIAAFTDEEETIKLATQATIDLAAAKGMDLVAAADLVSKSLGSSTNALSRYGIEVTGAVGSQERLETLTRNVGNLFGGQAAAQAQTMSGALDQMKNAVGDAAENLGDLMGPTIISIAKGFKGAAEAVGGFLESLKDIPTEEALASVSMEALNKAIKDRKDDLAEFELFGVPQVINDTTKALEAELAALEARRDLLSGMSETERFEFAAKEEQQKRTDESVQKALESEKLEFTERQIRRKKEGFEFNKVEKSKLSTALAANKAQLDAEALLMREKVKNAATSAKSASEGAKSVIKGESMKAISGLIASILRGVPYPFNLLLAATAGGAANTLIDKGLAQIPAFATGGSFVTGGDQVIRVGDNPTGREVVNVTPLDAAGEPTGGGGMITVNVSGNVMSENYTEDVIIPHIKEALRRGESIA
jgi:hypothetical protein